MSKKDKDTETALPDEEETVTEEPLPEPEVVAAPAKSSSGSIAWLALLLSLIASVGIGYMIIQDWRAQRTSDASTSSLVDLRNRMASSSDSLSILDKGIAELAQADALTSA